MRQRRDTVGYMVHQVNSMIMAMFTQALPLAMNCLCLAKARERQPEMYASYEVLFNFTYWHFFAVMFYLDILRYVIGVTIGKD